MTASTSLLDHLTIFEELLECPMIDKMHALVTASKILFPFGILGNGIPFSYRHLTPITDRPWLGTWVTHLPGYTYDQICQRREMAASDTYTNYVHAPIIPIYCGIHTKHQKIIVYRGSSRDHQFQGGLSHLHYYSIDFGPHRSTVDYYITKRWKYFFLNYAIDGNSTLATNKNLKFSKFFKHKLNFIRSNF